MFLAEGMNIKMLLLPDGDDPDSFARKHTAADFRQYVADHQEDFLVFKTRYLLKGVTDPSKRSEGIASIVKSISVITDQIVRSTYIKECAQRIGMSERALIYEMNKYIRRDREEQMRQKEREAERQRIASPQKVSQGPLTATQMTADVETLLIQLVVRHGAEKVFRELVAEDGSAFDLSVAEFIIYNLEEDGLRLENSLYQGMLEEAVALVQQGETDLLGHFERHPDVRVSSEATRLSVTYQLSESNQVRMNDETLRSQVEHVLLDYRMAIVKSREEVLRQQLALANSSEEKREILAEMSNLLAMRKEIARMVGKSIII